MRLQNREIFRIWGKYLLGLAFMVISQRFILAEGIEFLLIFILTETHERAILRKSFLRLNRLSIQDWNLWLQILKCVIVTGWFFLLIVKNLLVRFYGWLWNMQSLDVCILNLLYLWLQTHVLLDLDKAILAKALFAKKTDQVLVVELNLIMAFHVATNQSHCLILLEILLQRVIVTAGFS